MKKLLSILLICTLLCGCSGQTASDTTTTTASTTTSNTTTSATTTTPQTTTTPETTESTLSSLQEYIDSLPGFYEGDGFITKFKIFYGEHDHSDADPSDKELIELGESKLADANKIFSVLAGTTPKNTQYSLPYGLSEIYAIDQEFGDYESLTKLCSDTFAENLIYWQSGYNSVDLPEEVLEKYTYEEKYGSSVIIRDRLKNAMCVQDGVTYGTKIAYAGGNPTLETKIEGVLRESDDCIVYRLCTLTDHSMATDSPVTTHYEHSIMKLELIDGKWLITQIKDGLCR